MTGKEQDRQAIFESLIPAGWQLSDRGKVTHKAYMEYVTPSGLLLEVQEGVNQERNRFFFFYLSPGFAQGVQLNVHFDDVPAVRDAVLKYIVEHQNDFSEDTYKRHLREMLKLGPRILLDIDDTLIPLADDEASLA